MLHSLPKSPLSFLTFCFVITLWQWGGVISLLKSSITLYCRNRMGNYSAKSPTFYTPCCFGSDVCWEKLLRPYPPFCYMLEWAWKWGIDKFFCHGHGEIGHIPQQRSRGRRVSRTTASTTATIIISAFVSVLVLARRDARVEACSCHSCLRDCAAGARTRLRRKELCRKVPQNVQAGRRSWRPWSRQLSA